MKKERAEVTEDSVLEIRADGVRMVGTRWVAIIDLLAADVVERDGSAIVADRVMAQAKLAWPIAKALHKMLGDVIAGYEDNEGAIPLPSSFAATRSPND